MSGGRVHPATKQRDSGRHLAWFFSILLKGNVIDSQTKIANLSMMNYKICCEGSTPEIYQSGPIALFE